MDFDIYLLSCIHHYSIIQNSVTALKPSVLYLFNQTPILFRTTDQFTFSIVFVIPQCHIIQIMQYIVFPDRFLCMQQHLLFFITLKFNLYCIFSLPLVPLYPFPPAITTLLSMSMSPLTSLLNPSTSSFTLSNSLSSYSMRLPLLSLLLEFIHQIPHISEITWYLSFFDWLTYLSYCSPGPALLSQKVILFFFMAEQYSVV